MTARRVRWEPVVNEVLLAAGPGYRSEINAREWGTHRAFAATASDLSSDPKTWADLIAQHAFTVMSQTDRAALRTSLIALAGLSVSWVFDLDTLDHNEAA